MSDDYVREFERYLVGTKAQRAEWCAELEAHLQQAREAGDLDGALSRLGSPREAAAAFSSVPVIVPAPPYRRHLAQVVDNFPLVVVTVVAAIATIVSGGRSISFGFPPALVISSAFPLLRNIAIPLALLWSWLGLALLEAPTGRTPGKALVGIRTVSSDGAALTRAQSIKRRISILFGVFAWIDWAAGRFTSRGQRLFDLLAHTVVVDDRRVRSGVQGSSRDSIGRPNSS